MTQIRKDVLALIKDQHQILKESIEVIKSDDEKESAKQDHLENFISLLKMHSEAEEETLYSVMREIESEHQTVFEADEEHGLAKILVSELEAMNYKEDWNDEVAAKAKVLVEVVEHHIKEEEDEFFKAARENLASVELQAIGDEFLKKCDEFEESDLEIGQVMNQRRQVQENNVALSLH